MTQHHLLLVFKQLSSLFLLFIFQIPPHSSYLLHLSPLSLCVSVSFICLRWATPTPGDHFGGRYIDHHWLHPGGLHHAGLRRLLLHWREPQHGRPSRIACQQQLYGMPKRCKSALCYAITHILVADGSLQLLCFYGILEF